jgi:hypothetical protein
LIPLILLVVCHIGYQYPMSTKSPLTMCTLLHFTMHVNMCPTPDLGGGGIRIPAHIHGTYHKLYYISCRIKPRIYIDDLRFPYSIPSQIFDKSNCNKLQD